MPAVTASLAAIYCYWRIEQELLHPMYASQLARWQGADIRGHLLQILGQLQQGAHPASQDFARRFNLPIYFQLRVQELTKALDAALLPRGTPLPAAAAAARHGRRPRLGLRCAPLLLALCAAHAALGPLPPPRPPDPGLLVVFALPVALAAPHR